jgi:hypothetical protein
MLQDTKRIISKILAIVIISTVLACGGGGGSREESSNSLPLPQENSPEAPLPSLVVEYQGPLQIEYGQNFNTSIIVGELAASSEGPLQFKLDFAPDGMTIDESGNISWHAQLPLDDADVVINVGVTASTKNQSGVAEFSFTVSKAEDAYFSMSPSFSGEIANQSITKFARIYDHFGTQRDLLIAQNNMFYT